MAVNSCYRFGELLKNLPMEAKFSIIMKTVGDFAARHRTRFRSWLAQCMYGAFGFIAKILAAHPLQAPAILPAKIIIAHYYVYS